MKITFSRLNISLLSATDCRSCPACNQLFSPQTAEIGTSPITTLMGKQKKMDGLIVLCYSFLSFFMWHQAFCKVVLSETTDLGFGFMLLHGFKYLQLHHLSFKSYRFKLLLTRVERQGRFLSVSPPDAISKQSTLYK